ncbi:MAG: hypothetical protein ACI9GW_001199 [Halieaceae bacterium]|jgi:hypothetical protein
MTSLLTLIGVSEAIEREQDRIFQHEQRENTFSEQSYLALSESFQGKKQDMSAMNASGMVLELRKQCYDNAQEWGYFSKVHERVI